MILSRIKRFLVGEPLSNNMLSHERIPKWKALAVLSSDALSSVAYATEEILIPLSLLSVAAVAWSMPIALAIGALLVIITLSYRQTIDAYPNGGGAYIVAKENLGTYAGLVAGASLLIDYILTVAVSVAAGVENVASAFPSLQDHKVAIGIFVIFVIMVFNLRGIKESASIFALPTYLFIGSFILLILVGSIRAITGDIPKVAPIMHEVYPTIPIFLGLRAFASGCAALSGIEAISNGIPIFREPTQKNAKTTLLWMSIILGIFFLGITFLTHLFGILPIKGETTVSSLARTIFGDSALYYVVQGSTALILFLAANTSYADFPRLASLLANDRYLPKQLASLGDRLVFSNGILGLSFAAMLLIIFFHGDTHHLIPLYAIGVFLSFTLSQAGMVIHHLKKKGKDWQKSLGFNLLGAITTLVVLIVIASTKFMAGAWIVVLLIPSFVFLFTRIHKHYIEFSKALSLSGEKAPEHLLPLRHIVVVPVSGVHRGVLDALRYAVSISHDVRACYIEFDANTTAQVEEEWQKWAHEVPLVILKSPYRSIVSPLLNYIDSISECNRRELITVLIPEFITTKWWHQFLHNHTALFLRTALMFKPGKVVTSVRYHLKQ